MFRKHINQLTRKNDVNDLNENLGQELVDRSVMLRDSLDLSSLSSLTSSTRASVALSGNKSEIIDQLLQMPKEYVMALTEAVKDKKVHEYLKSGPSPSTASSKPLSNSVKCKRWRDSLSQKRDTISRPFLESMKSLTKKEKKKVLEEVLCDEDMKESVIEAGYIEQSEEISVAVAANKIQKSMVKKAMATRHKDIEESEDIEESKETKK